MAYIVSPYAGAAEFPSDNLPAQLLSQGLQAGYARRMKEMENKMKLQEEGKKAFDEAYKYAKLDLSKVDPAYHEELKRQAENLGKNMVAAYQANPTAFPNNTAIAEEGRRLNTLKTEYEALSSDIQKADDARRQLEKEGKFDITATENRKILDALRTEQDSAKRAELFEAFKRGYKGGELDKATPKVADYTWEGNVAKEAKDLIASQQGRKLDYTQRKTFEDVIMKDEYKKSSLAKQIDLDISTPEGEQELKKRIQSYLPQGEKPAPQGGGGIYLGGNSVANKKTILTTVSSVENKDLGYEAYYNSYVDSFAEQVPEYQRKKKEAADRGGVYTLETFKKEGGIERLKKEYPELFSKYDKAAQQKAERDARENVNISYFSTIAPTINPVGMVIDKKNNKYGRPISFSTDKNNVITNLQYMAEKKLDGRTVLEPEASPITAENWIQIRDNYQLQDLIEEKGFKLPKNVQEQLDMKRSPSGGKPAAEKPKGEKGGFMGASPKRKMN